RAGDRGPAAGRERPLSPLEHRRLRRGVLPAMSRRWIFALALLPTVVAAEPRNYRVGSPAEGSKAEAVVVYSLGSHTQTAQEIRGEVTADPTTLASVSGTVVIPLAGIRGDGGTRDCHMREALGLDYGAGGRFPAEHVCDANNQVPSSGPDAIAFPDIQMELLSARPLDDLSLLGQGQPVRVELQVKWTIHGVTHTQKELTRVLRDGNGLHARGRSTIVLQDFHVVTKPVKVLFAEVKVGDAVTVTYDLRLLPVSS